MKKKGFTLAEVLITLGIVGVVAAITIPGLITNTSGAQVGPKLAKAVAMFEQANEALLNANSADLLTDTGFFSGSSIGTYGGQLSNYLKITELNDTTYLSKDGMAYIVTLTDTSPDNTNEPAHKQRIGDVCIDINGQTGPNVNGTDMFYFSWWNDGSLRAKGSTDWDGSGNAGTWEDNCPANATPSDATFCAGHVFENNLKVLYK